jgi:ankyrin repeat protein
MSINDFKNFILDHQWQNAIDLIKIDPSVLRKRYAIPAFVEGKDASDVHAIHHACSMADVPLALIQTILFACPESIQKTESALHRTCLHIAILKGLPDEIVSFLIKAYPEAIQAQDKIGRVPLHYACSNIRSYESMKDIILTFPQCIRAPDWKNWTPLHVASTKNTDPNIIELMTSLEPEAVIMVNNSGSNAFKLALDSNQYVNRESILEILERKMNELDDKPESKNLRGRPMTPVQMKPYCLV